MPGIDLDLPPSDPLGSRDGLGAESGPGEGIGDLLAQEQMEEQLREGKKGNFEDTLRCAVAEFHVDLQAFGSRLDARLEGSLAQLTPLARAMTGLQEENSRLRLQQERLVRQVENLCKKAGLAEPLMHVRPRQEDLCSPIQCETTAPVNPEDSTSIVPEETSSNDSVLVSPEDIPSSGTDPPSSPHLDSPSSQTPVSPGDPPDSGTMETPSSPHLDSPSSHTPDSPHLDSSSSQTPDSPPARGTMETPFSAHLDSPSGQNQAPGPAAQSSETVPEEAIAYQNPVEDLQHQIEAPTPPDPPSLETPHCSSEPSLRASSPGPGGMMETEPGVASEPLFSGGSSVCGSFRAPAVPNGSGTTGTTGTTGAQTKPAEQSGKLTESQLAAIEDEELLDRMLDESKDFEERRLIRAAMRDLRKRKRDQREKEREVRLQELRQQREERGQKGRGAAGGETVLKKVETSADGLSHSQLTKTDRFAQSDDGSRSTRSSVMEASYVQKTDRGTVQSKSYSFSSSTSSMSSSSSGSARKVGSVFDREDATPLRGGGGSRGGLAAVERRQAEQRKELMRAQSMPKGSAMTARKAMIERLEKEGGGPGNQAVAKVQRSTSFGVPNANSIKQMLLDWCRAKTRCYENVAIQNFSSSWSSGMAFCALVHHFFPDAFDYEALSPSNRRHNFEVAFSNAEKLVDCPQLLDVEDMVKMREPDWKCVYTYLQEFYRGLVLKGLVKTKSSASS
ncbi:unnamed protein product [Arctogadus glacialis]